MGFGKFFKLEEVWVVWIYDHRLSLHLLPAPLFLYNTFWLRCPVTLLPFCHFGFLDLLTSLYSASLLSAPATHHVTWSSLPGMVTVSSPTCLSPLLLVLLLSIIKKPQPLGSSYVFLLLFNWHFYSQHSLLYDVTLNTWSSYLSLPNAGITSKQHFVQ